MLQWTLEAILRLRSHPLFNANWWSCICNRLIVEGGVWGGGGGVVFPHGLFHPLLMTASALRKGWFRRSGGAENGDGRGHGKTPILCSLPWPTPLTKTRGDMVQYKVANSLTNCYLTINIGPCTKGLRSVTFSDNSGNYFSCLFIFRFDFTSITELTELKWIRH